MQAGLTGQGAPVAPGLVYRHFFFFGLGGFASVQLMAGLVVGLIALYSSYDHINFGPARVQLEQALSKLSTGEVQALYDDEVLELLVGLR